MEKDDEVKDSGNSYSTEFRQYDPRIGKWFSIDPKMSAWESPYVSMVNNPLLYSDIMGDTIKYGPRTVLTIKPQIDKLKSESIFFNAVYEYLNNSKTVYIVKNGEGTNTLKRANGKFIPHPQKNYNSIILKEENSVNTMVEEFFHGVQWEIYGESRTVPEMEAEANLMQVIVMGELNIDLVYQRGSFYDLAEPKFFEELMQNDYTVTPNTEIEKLYFDYLEAERNQNIGQNEAYDGFQRPLIPLAYNKIILSTKINNSIKIPPPKQQIYEYKKNKEK
jgi:RHS repeat-associated protein